jgi:hypothetical protein
MCPYLSSRVIKDLIVIGEIELDSYSIIVRHSLFFSRIKPLIAVTN